MDNSCQNRNAPAATSKSPDARAACTAQPQTQTSIRLKIRRIFSGIRDELGRAQPQNKSMERKQNEGEEDERPKKKREYPIPPPGYVFGVKPWLKRLEVWWEYGLSPRSVRRLEDRGLLHARVLTGHYLYERAEIDAAIRDARLLDPDGGTL
jgi:hypothetical protein